MSRSQPSSRRLSNSTYSDKASWKVKGRHNGNYTYGRAIVNGVLSEISELLSDVSKLPIDIGCFELVVLIEHIASLSMSASYTSLVLHGICEQGQWCSVFLLVESQHYQ